MFLTQWCSQSDGDLVQTVVCIVGQSSVRSNNGRDQVKLNTSSQC